MINQVCPHCKSEDHWKVLETNYTYGPHMSGVHVYENAVCENMLECDNAPGQFQKCGYQLVREDCLQKEYKKDE